MGEAAGDANSNNGGGANTEAEAEAEAEAGDRAEPGPQAGLQLSRCRPR